MWAELSEDSVTVYNGLMADAVREFSGTHTHQHTQSTWHAHTYSAHSRYTVTNDRGTNIFTAAEATAKKQVCVTRVDNNHADKHRIPVTLNELLDADNSKKKKKKKKTYVTARTDTNAHTQKQCSQVMTGWPHPTGPLGRWMAHQRECRVWWDALRVW